MANNNLASHLLVYEGDVQRRMYTTYTPDFYLDDDALAVVTSLTRVGLAEMDRVLELSKALPYLSRVENCPEQFLPSLGKLVGYTWVPSKSVAAQRQELKKIVDVYAIKGTPASVVRVVLSAGATNASVFTPFDKLVFLDSNCRLDDGFYLEDGVYWRWGTYEVRGDISFSLFHSQIEEVHPAGTVWFGRESVASSSTESSNAPSEAEVDIFHITYDDYAASNNTDPVILIKDEALATTSGANATQTVTALVNRPVSPGTVRVVAGAQVLVDIPTNDTEGAVVDEAGQSIGTTNKITYATGVFNNSSAGDNNLAFPASVASGVNITADYYHNGSIAYWKLNEPINLAYSAGTAADAYGTSSYNAASYGRSFVGLIAADTSANGQSVGKYNSVTEVLATARGRQRLFGDYTLTKTPIINGSVSVKVNGQNLVDDGLGALRRRGSSVNESVYQGNGVDLNFTFQSMNGLIIPRTFSVNATSINDVSMRLTDNGLGVLVDGNGVEFGTIDYQNGKGSAQFKSPIKLGSYATATYDYKADFISATLNYLTGELNDLNFEFIPGAVNTSLPVFQSNLLDLSNGTSSIPRPSLFYLGSDSDVTTDVTHKVTEWSDQAYSDLPSKSGNNLVGSTTSNNQNPVYDPFSRVSETSKLYWLDKFSINGSTVRGARPVQRDALGNIKKWATPKYITFNGANFLTLGSSKPLYVSHTISTVVRFNRADGERTIIGDYTNKSRIWYDGPNSKFKYTANNSGTAVTVEVPFSLKDLYLDKEDNWFILTVSRGTPDSPTSATSNGDGTATPTIPNLSANVAPGTVILTTTTAGAVTLVDDGSGAFMVKSTGASAGGSINYATGVITTSPTWPTPYPEAATNNITRTFTTTSSNDKVKFYVNGSQVVGSGGTTGETLSSATATFTATYVGGYDGTSSPVRNYSLIAHGNGTTRPLLDGTTKASVSSQTIGTVGGSDSSTTGLLAATSVSEPVSQGGDLVPGTFTVTATRADSHASGTAGASITMQDSGNGYMTGSVAAGSLSTVKSGLSPATSVAHIAITSIIGAESVGSGNNTNNPSISTLTYAPIVPLGKYATATFEAGSQKLYTDVSGNIYSTITQAPTQSTTKLIENNPASNAVGLAQTTGGRLIAGTTYYVTLVYKDSEGKTTGIGASRQSQGITGSNNAITATVATLPAGAVSASLYISTTSGKELLIKEGLSAGAVTITDDSIVGKVNLTSGDVTDAGGSSGSPYWPTSVATSTEIKVTYRAQDRLNFSDELKAGTNVVASYDYYNQVISSSAVVPYSLILYVGPDNGEDFIPTEFIEEASSTSTRRQYSYDVPAAGNADGSFGGDAVGRVVYATGKLSHIGGSYSASPTWDFEVPGGSVVKASWVTGGANFDGFEGAISQLAVYSQPLTAAQQSVLEENLSLKYEIPLNVRAWFSRENLVGPFRSTVTNELVTTKKLNLKTRDEALALGADPNVWAMVEATSNIYDYYYLLGESLSKYVASVEIELPTVSTLFLPGTEAAYVSNRIVPGTLSLYLNLEGGGTIKLFDGAFVDNGPLVKLSDGGAEKLSRSLYVLNVSGQTLDHAATPVDDSFVSVPTLVDPNDYIPPIFYNPKAAPKTYEVLSLVNGNTFKISTEKMRLVYSGTTGPALDIANVKAWATYEVDTWIDDNTTLTNSTDWKSTSIVPSKIDTYGGTSNPSYQLFTLDTLVSKSEYFDVGDGLKKFFELNLSSKNIKIGSIVLSGKASALPNPSQPYDLLDKFKPSPLTTAGVITRELSTAPPRASIQVTESPGISDYTQYANIKLDPVPYYYKVDGQADPALEIITGRFRNSATYEPDESNAGGALTDADGEVALKNVGRTIEGGTDGKYYSSDYANANLRDTTSFKMSSGGTSSRNLMKYTYRENLGSYTNSLINQLNKYAISITWVNSAGESALSPPIVRERGHKTGSVDPLQYGGLGGLTLTIPKAPQSAEYFKVYISTNDGAYYEYIDAGEPQSVEVIGRGTREGAVTADRLYRLRLPPGYVVKPASAAGAEGTDWATDGIAISRSYGNYTDSRTSSGAGVVGTTVTRTTLTSTANSGQNVVNVTSSTGFADGDVISIAMGTAAEEEAVIASGGITGNAITLVENLDSTHAAGVSVYSTDGIVQTLYDQGDGTLKGRDPSDTANVTGTINYKTGVIEVSDWGSSFDIASLIYAHRGAGTNIVQSAKPYLLPWIATRYNNSSVSGNPVAKGYLPSSYEGDFKWEIKTQPAISGSVGPSTNTSGTTISLRDGAGAETGNIYNSSGGPSVGTVRHSSGSLTAIFDYPLVSGYPITARYYRQENNYIGGDGQIAAFLQRDGNTAAYPVLQYTSANNSYSQLDSAMSLGSEHTIFIVARPTGLHSASADYTFIGDETSSQKQAITYSTNANSYTDDKLKYTFLDNGTSATITFDAYSTSPRETLHVFTIRREATKISHYLDGVKQQEVTSGLAAVDTFQWKYAGAYKASSGEPFEGDIAEILVYDKALSEEELAPIHKYLLSKFNLAKLPIEAFYNDYTERDVAGHLATSKATGTKLSAGSNGACITIPVTEAIALSDSTNAQACCWAIWVKPEVNASGTIWGLVWEDLYDSLTSSKRLHSINLYIDSLTGEPRLDIRSPYDGRPSGPASVTLERVKKVKYVEGNSGINLISEKNPPISIADGQWHLINITLKPATNSAYLHLDGEVYSENIGSYIGYSDNEIVGTGDGSASPTLNQLSGFPIPAASVDNFKLEAYTALGIKMVATVNSSGVISGDVSGGQLTLATGKWVTSPTWTTAPASGSAITATYNYDYSFNGVASPTAGQGIPIDGSAQYVLGALYQPIKKTKEFTPNTNPNKTVAVTNLSFTPIKKNNVKIIAKLKPADSGGLSYPAYDGILEDDGAGLLYGSGTGNLDYSTGVFTGNALTFTDPVVPSTNVTIEYEHEFNTSFSPSFLTCVLDDVVFYRDGTNSEIPKDEDIARHYAFGIGRLASSASNLRFGVSVTEPQVIDQLQFTKDYGFVIGRDELGSEQVLGGVVLAQNINDGLLESNRLTAATNASTGSYTNYPPNVGFYVKNPA